ncbi:hypothetical protein BDQ17DRAFT_182079 [Cyathus striatus]|nr:hypothetical protein BDQ17DRAFT_182079 [Cyathus striatus]
MLLALLCGRIMQKIFFGTLRPNEVERLYDRLWFFITESLLAFTIFRDEFDIPFALMFGFLLFVKSFHWLASDRIEWMDQRPYPGPNLSFHVRMLVLFTILWMTDFLMLIFALESTITNGVGGIVLFASEYGILIASIMNTIVKYLLSAYELRRAGQRGGENAPPWENKSMWVFYVELATDFLKLTTYLIFFMIIITFYGLPLHIIRDVYITARSFITRLRALHRYQTATRNMDERYPNASEEELAATSDRTCIICREEMLLQVAGAAPAGDGPNTTPKKLPCGHIFHFHCLRSWLERQQSCPTCRRNVLESNNAIDGTPDAPAQNPGIPQADRLAQGGPQNVNAQGLNNNNPLGGIVGRLFRNPAQEPNRYFPAQVPNLRNPNPPNAGQPPAGGIYVQYQIQYQFPPEHGQRHPQRPLQEVPRFPGFPGPEGAWRQWPNSPAHRDNETSGNITTISNPANAEEISPSTSLGNTLSRQRSDSRDSAADTNAESDSPFTDGPSQMKEHLPDQTSTPEPVHSVASSTSNIPDLVPLYDYSTITHGSSLAQNGMPSGVPNIETIVSQTGQPSFRPSHQTSPSVIEQQESRLPLLNAFTQRELAAMDVATREDIDERLRVLERVSNTVHNCIHDLMKLRSTLPPLNTVSNASDTNRVETDSSGANERESGQLQNTD